MLIDQIKRAVCREFHCTHAELVGPSRSARLVLPRHTAIYLAYELSAKGRRSLGSYFGGRDKQTILHACRATRTRLTTNADYAKTVTALRMQLKLRPADAATTNAILGFAA